MVRWRSLDDSNGGGPHRVFHLMRQFVSVAILSCLLNPAEVQAEDPDALRSREIRFSRRGETIASHTLAELMRAMTPQNARVFEPYEGREASFRAIPFDALLDATYGPSWRQEEELLFTCRDGYQPSVPVDRLLNHRAWLAFDRPGDQGFTLVKLESGRQRRIQLQPFYLIWENLEDTVVRSDGDYGWPYQLVAVDLIRTRDRFPRMAPAESSPPDVLTGFAAFRVHCSRCHKINGEGGSIGPELNAPINPTEHRTTEWLQRWIDDPAAIRADSRMPRMNPALLERDRVIDQIIVYLAAISKVKIPPKPEVLDGN